MSNDDEENEEEKENAKAGDGCGMVFVAGM